MESMIFQLLGHKKETFPEMGCHYIDNNNYETNNELSSLYSAIEKINGETIIGYGDTLFRSYILNMLEENTADIAIVVDGEQKAFKENYTGDFVTCTSPNQKSYENES